MNKIFKKIALPVLIALLSIVLCFFGNSFLSKKSIHVAEAASDVTATITANKTMVAPGESVTITITLHTAPGKYWKSLAFTFGEIGTDPTDAKTYGKGVATNAQYLSYVSHECNLNDTGSYEDNSSYVPENKSAAKVGMGVQFGTAYGEPISTDTDVVFSFTLQVSSDAGSIGKLTFGVGDATANKVGVPTDPVDEGVVPFTSITKNTVEIKLGTVSNNPNLSKLEAGGSTLAVVESNDSDSGISTSLSQTVRTSNRTAYKIVPTAKDGKLTKIKYSLGSSSNPETSNKEVESGKEITIALDSSGTTVVKFYTLAENETNHANYTFTIKNTYVSLSALGLNVTRQSGGPSLDSTFNTLSPAFAQDTDTDTATSNSAYTVKLPSDHTQVQITPTVAADFGINSQITVAATGANASGTTVNSGSAVTLTNVTNDATLKLTAKGVDNTTKEYTITFEVKNVDTSLALTMTSGGETLTGTSTGTGFSFTLKEEANFKGTFNATIAPGANLKIDSANYSASQEYTATASGTSLTFVVTAAAGNTKNYTVNLTRLVKAGELTNLKYQVGTDSQITVDNTNSTLSSGTSGDGKPNNVYTVRVDLDPANAAGKIFKINGTPTTGATTSTSANLSGAGTNAWQSSSGLVYNNGNTTTYTVTVSSTAGVTTYNFEVTLKENKNSITNIVFKQGGKTTTIPFDGIGTFNSGNTSYTINVPFKDYATVDVEVTTDGKYCKVEDGEGTYNTTAGTQSHTRASIALSAGSPKTLTFSAKADNGNGNAGTGYTVIITRAAADSDALLSSLDVKINGISTPFKDDAAFVGGTLVWNVEFDASAYTSNPTITLTAVPSSSKASITSDSDASTTGKSHTFSLTAGQEVTKTYTIKVQPEEGSATVYTVYVKNVIPDPEFTDLQISFVNQSSYYSVLSSFEYDSASKTYTIVKKIEADGVPVNSQVYIKGTTSTGASASATGLTQVTANKEWRLNQLPYGKTSFSVTVSAKGQNVQYKFEISLLEGKNEITALTLKKGSETLNFEEGSFNPSNYTYTIKVPYTYNTGNIDIEVTTDGLYTSVVDGKNTKFTSNNTSNKHTSSISCATLSTTGPTTVIIHAVSDPDYPQKEEGMPYTINIEREAADTNADLNFLKLYVNGTPVDFDGGVTFNPSTTTYTYTIPSPTGGATTAPIEIYAVADSAKSTITGGSSMGSYNKADTKFSFNYTYPTATKTDSYQIIVTPESGVSGQKTYTVQIKREIAKGDLTDVKISYDGLYFQSIFTEFDVSKTYNGKVDISELSKGLGSTIYIQAEATPDSTVTGSPLTKMTDHFQGNIGQFGNKNQYVLTASTGSGSTKYTINIEVYEDKDGITDIKMMNGSNELDGDVFTFSEYTDTYNVEVDYTISSVVIRVKAEGDYEIIKADGATVSAKKPDGYYEISSGSLSSTAKTIKVYGVANQGSGKTDGTAKGTEYTFVITKAKADADTTLSSLVVKIDGDEYDLLDGAGGNSINFDPDTNEYWVEFEKWGTATAATVSIEAEASNANSKVDGLPSGNNNFKYDVKKEHEETYNIVVTAQSGAKNTYKVHVKRTVYEGDFTTLEIKLPKENSYENVLESANYDEYDKVYTLNLTTAEASVGSAVTVKAIANSGSTVSTDPKLTAKGNEYTIKLEQGSHEYNFTATSSSGGTTYKFVINLFEEKNGIEKITFKHDKGTIGTETFNFNPNTNSYQFTVANTISALTMTVVTDGDYSTVVDSDSNALNAAKVARNFETTVTLAAGQTTTVGVRAVSDTDIDGDMYWIEITREAADSDTTLKSLSVTVGGKTVPFEEYFDPELTDYTVYLEANASGTYNAILNAVANKTTTTLTGTGSKQIQLANVPSQTLDVVTTAQNGDMRTYTITFMQKEPVVVDYIAKVRLDNDKDLAFTVNSDSQAFDVYKAKSVVFTKDKINFEIVSAKNGLTYTVYKIVNGNKSEEIELDDENDVMLDLDIGTNVYCVYFDVGSGDIKPVVFVMERVNPSLDGLSAREIRSLANDYTPEIDAYSYSVGSDITAITLNVDVDTSIYRYTIEGADELGYGMNQIVIKLYEKGKTRASAEPLRTITLSIYRESNNLFWIVMTSILGVLAVALVIIIILVKNRNNHNNHNDYDEPIIITQNPSGGQMGGGNPPIILNSQSGADGYYDPNDGNIY